MDGSQESENQREAALSFEQQTAGWAGRWGVCGGVFVANGLR